MLQNVVYLLMFLKRNKPHNEAILAALKYTQFVMLRIMYIFDRHGIKKLRVCLHGGRKILALGRSEKAEELFVWFRCRNVGWSGYQVGEGIKENLSAFHGF